MPTSDTGGDALPQDAHALPIPRNMPLPAASSSDNEAVKATALQAHHKVNKQTWDYVVRSGLAGGLAGCAVSSVLVPQSTITDMSTGQNCRWAA